MVKTFDKNAQRMKRHTRVRGKISGTPERPRLNVYRSNANIYAQVMTTSMASRWFPHPLLTRNSKALPATRKLPARSASWLQSAPRQRASTPSCSIVAATSTTVVWRSLLKAPAKAAWNSDRRRRNNGLQ